MALTIALCVGSFAVIYAKIDPWTRDFVNAATITPTSPPTKTAKSSKTNGSASTTNDSTVGAQPTETPAPDQPTDTPVPAEAAASPTATPGGFTPNYKVSSTMRVNLRSGASQNTDIVTTLDSGTELQYLNQSQPDNNGTIWLEFSTAAGDQGWIRQIDVAKTG